MWVHWILEGFLRAFAWVLPIFRESMPNVNLKPEKMRSLAKALPESSRPFDDGLYRALDIYFKEVLGRSVNGTTYAGIRARTTGAPQNHWSACGAPFTFYHCRTVNSLMRAGRQSLQSLWLRKLEEKFSKVPFGECMGSLQALGHKLQCFRRRNRRRLFGHGPLI